MIARVLSCLILLLTFQVGPLAQESSIEVLGAPEGESSGEVLPEGAEPAPPPPCGTQPITIARMQWPSSAILAEIHARILTASFGCEVRVQESDMAAAGSSMSTTGQPAVVPEMWIARIAEIWNAATKAQSVRQAGNAYAEAVFEGWFVPDYVVADRPDVLTIEGLKANASAFAAGGGRPRFVSCPLDWACAVINRNLLRANGLEAYFEVIEPANRFELDTLIAEAVGRQEPILFYYWQPNAVLSQFPFRQVDLGPYNRDNFACLGRVTCGAPQPTGFAPDPVIIAVAEWVFLNAPQVASYFGKSRMPLAEMNVMLQSVSDGATEEAVAEAFVSTRGEVWRPWAGLPREPEAE